MPVKIFLLGLPGSGKSTVARYITTFVRDRGCFATRINDYQILHKMFRDDIDGKKFRPTAHDGFDIIDLSVFNTSLQEVERTACHLISSAKKKEVILIEFARNDYCEAFKLFSRDFLQDSYFLFLDADIETCKRRISERVANPITDDDYFVSEYIFDAYYCKDNRHYMCSDLKTDYGIDDQNVKIINNADPQQDSARMIDQFVGFILKHEFNILDSAEALKV